DGRVLVSSSRDFSGVQWWDVATGKELVRPESGHRGWVADLAFSPDGKALFSLGGDGGFIAWNVATGRERNAVRLPLSAGPMFSPDGKKLLSLDADPDLRARKPFSVRWRDAATGKELGVLGEVPWANRIAFSRDGRRVALAEGDNGVIGVSVWDVASGKRLFR